jgi:hypothetical protein
MSKPADMASDTPAEAIEEALSDHHLEEAAEMLERSRASDPSEEFPLNGAPAESNHRSKPV